MLDFSIHSDSDRVGVVNRELNAKKSPTKKELETMADYILYGKDKNGKNAVERGEAQIETKYGSYQKKKSTSLDELMENPVFDERNLRPLGRRIYTNPKPVIDKSLPELQLLLEEIEKWQHIYDVATGKEIDPSIKPKTQTQIYKIKHFLIQLKTQQYVIQEAVRTVRSFPSPSFYSQYTEDAIPYVKPLGLKLGSTKRFLDPRNDKNSKFELQDGRADTLDFENQTHIYAILENYSLLYESSIDNPYGLSKYLLDTLDFYISITPLNESRLTILKMKKQKFQNVEIKAYLQNTQNLSYNENYISTIYTKEICKKIAEAVTLHKDYWLARNNPDLWKQCSRCGEWKLRDNREFVRKKSSSDGFTSRCKVCDKEIRNGIK